MSTLRSALDALRTDLAVGLLAVLVLLRWPEQIIGFVLDCMGVP